uniref:Variant surface glycoprotein 1125.2509 n=1 Tax=Trypanosoma brucei TaxID=5691 RepID=A0A1J0R849_9TRYP|nr:variant surface glycoprotein 1125.2509 [Trypanosoma brucei]
MGLYAKHSRRWSECRQLSSTVCLGKPSTDRFLHSFSQKKTIAESALGTIRDIYVSLADPDWQKLYPEKSPQETPTAKAVGCNKAKEENDCMSNWTKWTAAKARAKTQGKDAKFPRLSDEVTKSPWGKQQAEYVAHLEAGLSRLYAQYKAAEESAADPQNSGLQKQLDNALYGKDASSKDGKVPQTRTTSGDRNSDCKGKNVGKSLIGDLFCLCAVDNSMQTALSCGFSTPGCAATAWRSCTGASATATWTTIKEQCGHYLKPQLTHSAISMALSAFLGRLERDATKDIESANAVFLGQHNSGNCGDANAVRCVNYTDAFKGQAAAHKIAWFDAMLAADSELTALKAAQAAVEKTRQAIARATHQAKLIYRSLSVPGATKLPNPQGAPITIVQPTAEKENKCKIKNKTADECPSKHCDYDKEKGECTPKPGTENTAAGTGAAGTTTEKCKGKPEKDCKSPDCKWEGTECKYSILLVNKKMALSVTASFAS